MILSDVSSPVALMLTTYVSSTTPATVSVNVIFAVPGLRAFRMNIVSSVSRPWEMLASVFA